MNSIDTFCQITGIYKRFLNKLSWIFRKTFQVIYRYDKWHCYTFTEKPYAADLVNFCNNLSKRNTVLEIGCGLGDIIRRLYFSHKTGYDISPEVLRAAKMISFIQFKKINFLVYDFLNNVSENCFDVIICVNWIHSISPIALKDKLQRLFVNNLNKNGYLIIDTVQDKTYEYNHDVKYLMNGLNCTILRIGEYIAMREVFAIRKDFD